MAAGFANNSMLRGINDITLGQAGIQQTLCQGFGGVDKSIAMLGYQSQQAIANLAAQLAQCCCDTQRAVDGVRYDMAVQSSETRNALCNLSRDIIDNQNANYRALHEEIVANKIEAKNERIAELTQQVNALNLAQSQAAQNAYFAANNEAQTAELLRRLGRDPVAAYVVPNPNCCYQYNVQPAGACCNSGF